MTRKEIFDNICNGFKPSDKVGYSFKKMIAAVIIVVMLVISVLATYHDHSFVMPVLGVWIPFVTALVITSAVEKHNVLKMSSNEKPADIPPV